MASERSSGGRLVKRYARRQSQSAPGGLSYGDVDAGGFGGSDDDDQHTQSTALVIGSGLAASFVGFQNERERDGCAQANQRRRQRCR